MYSACCCIYSQKVGQQTCGLPKADFYHGHACKAKICPLIPQAAMTNSILSHSPSGPNFKKIPLTSQHCSMGRLRPHFSRLILWCSMGIPYVNYHNTGSNPVTGCLVSPHLTGGELAAQQWKLEQLQLGKISQQLQAYDFYLESLQFETPSSLNVICSILCRSSSAVNTKS